MILNLLKIYKKDYLTKKEFYFIKNIIKRENPDSIIATLNNKLLLKYLKIITKSDKINLFTCELKKKIIGYLIISEKPKDLFSEFKSIKKEMLYYLVKKIKIFILLNLLIKFLKIDLILIPPNSKAIIEKNANLNMIGIESKFQSMGIGYFFLKKVISIITNKGDYKYLSLETLNYRAENFYKRKFNFYYIGSKLRFFKNLKILIKKL
jgi:ribosomal protein S18 acetylase RimI-like enzyme